jgi:hypothetical protein
LGQLREAQIAAASLPHFEHQLKRHKRRLCRIVIDLDDARLHASSYNEDVRSADGARNPHLLPRCDDFS